MLSSASATVKPARFPSFRTEPVEPAPAPRPLVDESAKARELARREGLALGQDQGRLAAVEEWTPRLEALAAALEDAIGIARAERERFAAELTRLVPAIALQLAQKVIEREVADGDAAARMVVDALARRLTHGTVCSLRVAPQTAAALDVWREARPGALDGVTVRADEALRPGDWVVETDGGFLDGRVATQLEEAARILTEPGA